MDDYPPRLIGSGIWEKPNTKGISYSHRIISVCIGLLCFLPIMKLNWFPLSVIPLWFYIFGYRMFSIWFQKDPFYLEVRKEFNSLPDVLEV